MSTNYYLHDRAHPDVDQIHIGKTGCGTVIIRGYRNGLADIIPGIHSWADWTRVLGNLPPSVKIVADDDYEVSATTLQHIVEGYSLTERAHEYRWCADHGYSDEMLCDPEGFSVSFKEFC